MTDEAGTEPEAARPSADAVPDGAAAKPSADELLDGSESGAVGAPTEEAGGGSEPRVAGASADQAGRGSGVPADEEGFVEWGAGGTWTHTATEAPGRSGGGRSRKSAKTVKTDKSTDPASAAREICLRLLSFSPRTRAQLADALRRKDIPDEVSEQVLGRFTEIGLIDDAAFAKAWVETRHAGRGLSRGALAAELRRRGVAAETVSGAVAELQPEQEEAAARHLIAKRLPATRGLDPVKRTRRLLGALARKGYPAGLSYRLVREALENEGTDPPDLPYDE